MPFPFENLTVYKHALDWVSLASKFSAKLSASLLRPLSDQLIWASTSIPLNIAEGNGRWHKGDKRQFFRIAMGSVFECVSILAIARTENVISDADYQTGYERLEVLAKMLTKLIQSVERLRDESLLINTA